MKDVDERTGRLNTRSFIEANPYTIILNRMPNYISDGAGGYKLPDAANAAPLEGQRVRVVPQSTGILRKSTLGEEVVTTHVIIGDLDLDIQRGDYFWVNREKIEVTFLWPPNAYEVRAEAGSRG